MKKILFILLTLSSFVFANVNVIVSIAPQETFVQAIGGDKVNITLMVKPGNSPHTYEPKPSQMKAISKAELYFSIGVEFEDVWLKRFQNQNQNMIIIDSSKNIKKINMLEHSHRAEEHEIEAKDPHIWTNPKNVKIIAQNIYEALADFDPENQKYYKENLKRYLEYITSIDKKIKNIIKPNSKFMIFHPSWGYFSKEYNITQIPIEVAGKSPKPKELKQLIEKAKKEKVNAIFTSPEFSDAIAKQISNELKIPVIKISPLAKNWGENLIYFAKNISNEN